MTLRIKKETLRNLSSDEQSQVAGGMPPTMIGPGCSADVCWTDAGPRCPTNSAIKPNFPCCA
jgi:hypothetical protein